jgi:predicted O-methyltransferase YrrM
MVSTLFSERVEKLKRRPWNGYEFRITVPEEIFEVPGMLWTQEKRMLYYLAREDYSGEGAIADMGSFLGGSTICFAAGLRAQALEDRVIHSYDLFKLGEAERERYFPENPPADLRTRAMFEEHLRDYLDLITVHEGDVLGFPWEDGRIETLFIDIAKSYRVFDHLLLNYFPALIPGKSLVVMQDYLSPQSGPWHHVVMERLADYFEYVVDCDCASVLFLLKKEIPSDVLGQSQWMEIPMDEKLALMERAIERLDTEAKRDFLRSNREILRKGLDRNWGMHYHSLTGQS